MNSHYLKHLLQQVRDGELDPDSALQRLKTLPYEDLGYAKIDHHRCVRNGVPEVVYCAGKTIPQITEIAFQSITAKEVIQVKANHYRIRNEIRQR